MVVSGIDVGSRTIKLAIFNPESASVIATKKVETTYDPLGQCRRVLGGMDFDCLIATGYGRKLVQEHFSAETITEIRAHALGARRLFPECRAVLDIGGQDTKAIALDVAGGVRKFEMNDRCAAGTGKFLEFMATSFQVPIERFGAFALTGEPGLTINSMCTVFAETEATSLMAGGNKPAAIARALHLSVVKRSLSMLRRIASDGPLVFSGGVARNRCMIELIEAEIGTALLVPQDPDMVGALGAALHGAENYSGKPLS